MDKIEFEKLFLSYKSMLERFVYFKLPSKSDGDDILQEVAISAYIHMNEIKNPESFKAWILKIAMNKCNDFYRTLAKRHEIPLDEMIDNIVAFNRYGISDTQVVRETLRNLKNKDKQILFLYYFKNKPQAEIASILNIPIGTVKSRLHTAKQNFKELYPFPPLLKESKDTKGEKNMKNIKTLPDIMPEYKITQSTKSLFDIKDVKWEESPGWFIIPKLGEKITWAMYDFPERNRTETVKMEVTSKANIHGIEGIEIKSVEYNPVDSNLIGDIKNQKMVERKFIAQLTDTHCRFLAESFTQNDIQIYHTFLDGDDGFNMYFGENNCGKEVNIKQKGIIKKDGNAIICREDKQVADIVGYYTVEINDKNYNTICFIDIELYDSGTLAEQYIDKNGKTVLWRRFNKNDWKTERYNEHFKRKGNWSEMFPENEQLTVNGEIYVHWYDCLTDYILL